MDTLLLVYVVAVFIAAGLVKGVSGMGLPTVAVSLLGLAMSPAAAAALLVAPSLVTNVAQCTGPHARALARRLWPAWLAMGVVTVWMPPVPVTAAGTIHWPQLALGLVLIGHATWGLCGARLPAPRTDHRALTTVVGLLTGAITAATAVFVMPLVPYLQSLRLSRDELIQALGMSFMVATLALAWRVGHESTLNFFSVDVLCALVAALLGLGVGTRIRGRLSAAAFQRALQFVFLFLGAANLWRSLP